MLGPWSATDVLDHAENLASGNPAERAAITACDGTDLVSAALDGLTVPVGAIRLGVRGTDPLEPAMLSHREVLILPRDAYGAGDRPDVLVQADATRGDSLPTDGPIVAKRLTVAIEIKDAWNRDLMTSQRTQLATRYLPAANTDAGLYLVVCSPLISGRLPGTPGRRKRRSSRTTV